MVTAEAPLPEPTAESAAEAPRVGSAAAPAFDVHTVFDLWDAAVDPQVVVATHAWPELDAVSRSCRTLRSNAEMSGVLQRLRNRTLAARRLLVTTPLPPDHPDVGLPGLAADVAAYADDHPGSTVADDLIELWMALEALTAAPSPNARHAENVLSCFGYDAGTARPEAVVVVPRAHLTGSVRGWLADVDLECVDVATPAQLRNSALYRAALVLGDPGWTYATSWSDPEQAARTFGWLLTAPPARTVHVAMLAGAPPLRPAASWLLAGASPALTLQTEPDAPASEKPGVTADAADAGPGPDSGPGTGPGAGADVGLWGEDEAPPAAAEPDLAGWYQSRAACATPADAYAVDAVNATAVVLASGHTVYFKDKVGPVPQVVSLDNEVESLSLARTPVSRLSPGMLLLERVGTATQVELVRRADVWVRQHRRWDDERIAHARADAQRLKFRLRRTLDRVGLDAVVLRLRDRGLEAGYASVLATAPLGPLYIAPRTGLAFAALAAVVEAPELLGRFDDLATIRVAHQQAGETVSRDLLTYLQNLPWAREVEESGYATLDGGPLGTLLVAAVAAAGQQSAAVPASWLGVPLDPTGRRATHISSQTAGAPV